MNICIPYKSEAHNGIELKYALRSIEKYLTGYEDIYLIGDKFPAWLQNVKFVNVSEPEKKTSRNILAKIMASFEHAGDTVLQWQDDIYLTKPLDIQNIKYWYEGTLEQAIERSHGGYKSLVENTARQITENGKFYDVHTPIIYHKKFLELVLSKYKWHKYQYLVKTLYCKQIPEWLIGRSDEIKDCKLHGPDTKENRLNKIKDALFFSTSPQSIDLDMIEIFETLYHEKSKYEIN